MNQGQDFSLLLGQGPGLPLYSPIFRASFRSLLASSSWSLFKSTLFASSTRSEIGSLVLFLGFVISSLCLGYEGMGQQDSSFHTF